MKGVICGEESQSYFCFAGPFFYSKPVSGIETFVSILIDTKAAGEKVAGTETLCFDVFDLTAWRQRSPQSEKDVKQFWLNRYQSKRQFQQYVQKAALPKVNARPLMVDTDGVARIELPYQQQEQPAVYLLAASGETGTQEFLPMVFFMPKEFPSETLALYGKYQEQQLAETVEEPKKLVNKPSKEKQLPQTNEVSSNVLLGGLLLALIGGMGLAYQKQKQEEK